MVQATFSIGTSLVGSNPVTQSNLSNSLANGQLIPSLPSDAGNGLPYTQITPNVDSRITRNIISWFVPQFGAVKMFINPQNITYNHKKLNYQR